MTTSTIKSTPPGTIVAAFFGFLVSTVTALAGAGLILANRQALVDTIRSQNTQYTDEQAQKAATLGVGFAVGVAVLIALFYLWLAFKLKAGRNWARIVLTIVTLLQVASMFVTQGNTVAGYIGCAISVIALVLSYLPASDAYIKQAH